MCVWKVMVAGVNVHGGYCRKAWSGSFVGIFSCVSSKRFLMSVKLSMNESLHMYYLSNHASYEIYMHVSVGVGGMIDDFYGCLSEKCEKWSRMNRVNGVDGIMSRKEFHFLIEVSSSTYDHDEIHDGHFWTCIKDHHRIFFTQNHSCIYIYVIYIHIYTYNNYT